MTAKSVETDPMSTAILAAAREAVQAEADAIADVVHQLDQSFIDCVAMVENTPGKIIALGSGTSGSVARRFAHLLSVSGTPGVFIHPMDALHGTMGAIQDTDLVFAFSKGGGSTEINDLCTRLRKKGVRIVAVTERPDSVMASLADLIIELHTSTEGDPGEVLAMGSTLVAGIWGDALVRVLMRKGQRSWVDTLLLHPAGAVGQMETAPKNPEPIVPLGD